MKLLPPALTRVMVEDSPSFFRLFAMIPVDDCLPVLQIEEYTYYRHRSTPRWVWYKAAISGSGETMDRAQR